MLIVWKVRFWVTQWENLPILHFHCTVVHNTPRGLFVSRIKELLAIPILQTFIGFGNTALVTAGCVHVEESGVHSCRLLKFSATPRFGDMNPLVSALWLFLPTVAYPPLKARSLIQHRRSAKNRSISRIWSSSYSAVNFIFTQHVIRWSGSVSDVRVTPEFSEQQSKHRNYQEASCVKRLTAFCFL